MKRQTLMLLAGWLLLVSCSQQQHAMQPQLDSIRVMIKQSALLAGEAICADAASRNALIHAAAVMNRRAMGGPEMAKIHKMMNMQPDANGKMPMKQDGKMSAEMKQHVALHDAGEDIFDFLDAVGGNPGISCDQAAPVSLAATAAMLREAGGREPQEVANKLDARASTLLKSAGLPDTAKAVMLALQKI